MQVEVASDFPVHLGGHVTVEMPKGLQVSTAIGQMPGFFVDVINSTALAFDAYGEDTASLVRASLRDSLVWRLHIGLRPLEDQGLYVEVGYGLVTLGSFVRGDNIVTVLEDEDREQMTLAYPSFEADMALGRYDVLSTLHMFDVELGWRWVLDSGWSFRVAFGLAATVYGHTTVDPVSTVLPDEVDSVVTRGTQQHLDTIYRKHVHTPVFSLGVGHRFF